MIAAISSTPRYLAILLVLATIKGPLLGGSLFLHATGNATVILVFSLPSNPKPSLLPKEIQPKGSETRVFGRRQRHKPSTLHVLMPYGGFQERGSMYPESQKARYSSSLGCQSFPTKQPTPNYQVLHVTLRSNCQSHFSCVYSATQA